MIQGIKDAMILLETRTPVEETARVKATLFDVENESRKPPKKAAVLGLTRSGSTIGISVP
jgi:hypothetical protein